MVFVDINKKLKLIPIDGVIVMFRAKDERWGNNCVLILWICTFNRWRDSWHARTWIPKMTCFSLIYQERLISFTCEVTFCADNRLIGLEVIDALMCKIVWSSEGPTVYTPFEFRFALEPFTMTLANDLEHFHFQIQHQI